jgi:aryl-alcohol dehydrogenase-like predicted oxidoreductase
MQYQTLGKSDLEVSRIALGTMTFGRQNSEAEAFEQLDYALAQGINLIDAAEMYPPSFRGARSSTLATGCVGAAAASR